MRAAMRADRSERRRRW